MSLDDYFDVDGQVFYPIKKNILINSFQYEYDSEMEDIYRKDLVKSFKKNVDGGFFKFLIVDAINSSIDHFNTIWSHAKQNGFEVQAVLSVQLIKRFIKISKIHRSMYAL